MRGTTPENVFVEPAVERKSAAGCSARVVMYDVSRGARKREYTPPVLAPLPCAAVAAGRWRGAGARALHRESDSGIGLNTRPSWLPAASRTNGRGSKLGGRSAKWWVTTMGRQLCLCKSIKQHRFYKQCCEDTALQSLAPPCTAVGSKQVSNSTGSSFLRQAWFI